MDEKYQRMTEESFDRAAQKFVEREFTKAVREANRFAAKENAEPKVKGTGVDRHV